MVAKKNRPLPSSLSPSIHKAKKTPVMRQYSVTVSARFDEERLMELEDLDDPTNSTEIDCYADACDRAEINDEMSNALLFVSDGQIDSSNGLFLPYTKVYRVESDSKDGACERAVEMLLQNMAETQEGCTSGAEEIYWLETQTDGLDFKIEAA